MYDRLITGSTCNTCPKAIRNHILLYKGKRYYMPPESKDFNIVLAFKRQHDIKANMRLEEITNLDWRTNV